MDTTAPPHLNTPLAFRHFPCISRLIKHPVIWLVALRKAGFFVETVWNHRVPASRVSALDRTEQTLFLPRALPAPKEQSLRLGANPGGIDETQERQRFMALYEHIFLARQDLAAPQVDALVETYKGVIESLGGKVGRIENWGLKSLTYRINKNRKAFYVLMDVDAPPAALQEVERQQRYSEDVLRFMTVKVEAHEDGPSAMMQKRDRDDRPRREDGDRPFRPRREDGDRPPRRDGDRPFRPREN
jgi:small subunit ribosomal protein S6